ncbi:MAG: polyamine aminopropyltransferase [Cytophagaceae bacterium]|jgi:spermidine synthase|nr:polyamine aminopropyltransferase [Cytophagaceae bacterium]
MARQWLLLVSVLVVATCGLIYELVAGTLASYLLGDSVTQFSTIIGVYLFSMGVGSYFSKYIDRNLIGWFIQIELLVGLVGGISSTLLFVLFDAVSSFRLLLYFLVFLTGSLVGLEIPLLMRILQDRFAFKDLVSQIFTFDYLGALLASLVFPLLLVPYLGLIKTSYFFGILNIVVALIVVYKFGNETSWSFYLKTLAWFILALLLAGFFYAESIQSYAENSVYPDKIIYARSSPYQRVVITKSPREWRLFLNGNLQFSSRDEYRYHEALVHPGLGYARKGKALVLGGGDGMALREILQYPDLDSVTLVDLDPLVTQLFKRNEMLSGLNDSSLWNPKVQLINQDAFVWIKKEQQAYDFVAVDFPDPSNYSIGKLYSTTFYKELYRVLKDSGVAIIQSTSPYVAPNSFWCIDTTLRACGFFTLPYHVHVPSFGDWGFLLVSKKNIAPQEVRVPSTCRFLSDSMFPQLCYFPKDMSKRPTDINRLNNQSLVHYFEKEWSHLVP